MLESKLKKAEVTIADQGMIVAAKSQHYEDKFKAMTKEHQAAIKKATHKAQAQLDTAQVQHEQDMASYREGLKSSVIISLLQTRLKMAYEARAWASNALLGMSMLGRQILEISEAIPWNILMLVVILVRVLMKLCLKRVLLLDGSEVGDDGCLCLGRSPLFLNLMVVVDKQFTFLSFKQFNFLHLEQFDGQT
ncbi:hypothetical protein HanPI659440_Chr08g0311111 [Helianthus annuus]|nr:hypothetical protein HanPI659440_Chr08g0311111 [Helianthus annuus]